MRDLTTDQWIEILFFDVMVSLPIPVTLAEFEMQLEAVRECMA